MIEKIVKFTKITFIIHFILGVIMAIVLWIPPIGAPLFGISYTADTGALSMILGAAGMGLTIGSLLGYLAKEWKEVKIVVITEIVWLACFLIAVIINIAVFGLSAILLIIEGIVLLALFLLSYLQQQEVIKELIK